jgi:hypothetical protein
MNNNLTKILTIKTLFENNYKLSIYKQRKMQEFLNQIYVNTIWYFCPDMIGGEYRGFDLQNRQSYYLNVSFLKTNCLSLPPDYSILSLELFDMIKRNFK